MAKKMVKKDNKSKSQEPNEPKNEDTLAVVQISGHQFLVKEGDEFEIDNQGLEIGKKIEAPVLLTIEGDGVKVGQPYVEGSRVELEVLENKKGVKIEVMKYKAKSRYRKHIGYRSHLTKVRVLDIKL